MLIAAGAPLDGLDRWARGDLLEIVLLVLGAILLTRLAEWTRDLVVTRIDRNARETDELVRSEAAKHRHVVAQVVTWAFLAVVYLVAAVLVVQRLGIPLAGLVAPAALLSAALGFGLQRFVQDIGAGFFITAEHQYGFGDVVPDLGHRGVGASRRHGRGRHPPGDPHPVGRGRGHHDPQRPDNPGDQPVA